MGHEMLEQQLQLKHTQLRNRLVMGSMHTGLEEGWHNRKGLQCGMHLRTVDYVAFSGIAEKQKNLPRACMERIFTLTLFADDYSMWYQVALVWSRVVSCHGVVPTGRDASDLASCRCERAVSRRPL